MVNAPLVSNYPVRPNIILNSFSAILIGLILSSGYVIYKAYIKINKAEIFNMQEQEQEQEQEFDPEMQANENEFEQAPIKTMLSEPFGRKYYFKD